MSLTCYVDEAGCPGKLPSPTSEIQPFLIVAAVCLRNADETTFTRQFTALKQRYGHDMAPCTPMAVGLLDEIKGCHLRSRMRLAPRGCGPEFVFLNELLRLLKSFEACIFARVAPKPPGQRFDGRAVYAQAMSGIARDFHRLLELKRVHGHIVADFREAKLNAFMTGPICEAKYQCADELPRLCGVPTFGHSQNHAGLQVADLVASALVYPLVSQWLMLSHGWRIDTPRFHWDASYAERYLALALASPSLAVRECAQWLVMQREGLASCDPLASEAT